MCRSVVAQEQGLLYPMATFETQDHGPEPPGSRTVRLEPGGFSVGGVGSLGRGFVEKWRQLPCE